MTNQKLLEPAWIEIDIKQFKKNIGIIRKHIQNSLFCLPIKANAYGHGLVPIAQAAVEAGVDYFGVARLQEGIQLRTAGIRKPILILGALDEVQIPELLHYELELSIASLYKAKLVAKQCERMGQRCRVHVEIETGMQRTGVRPATGIELLNYLYTTPCFEVVGIYSHFATAEDPYDEGTQHQITVFNQFTSEIKSKISNVIYHLSNSGGVCYYPQANLNMVRPGILTFGYFPYLLPETLNGIEPFLSVKAKIAYFKVVAKNHGISYGHSYKTNANARIVTIPVGYGDGYRRALSNKGEVLIRGRRYPIVGMICMDQFMVNIEQDEAYVGEEAILIGKQNNAEIRLTELAKLCDTIPYEILCGFNDRLPRYYINSGLDKG